MRKAVSRSSSDRVRLPQVVGPATLTDEQRAADKWVRESAQDALPRIRELARQWGGTVTALTGLFGVGALASGDAAVRALTTGWRVVYALTGLTALACAAAAITWAALAGQATVTIVSADVRDREEQRRSRVARAMRQLQLSRAAAAAALVLGAAAVVVRWFAPTASP